MKNFLKGKVATFIVVVATFILAGIAVFTAIRLYELRQTSVSPAAPSSQPFAQELNNNAGSCKLSFTLTISTPSPTPSPTGSPRVTPSPTPTETPTGSPTASPTGTPGSTETPTPTPTSPPGQPNSCGGTCGSNSNCQANYVCYQGFCRNPSCTQSVNCVCAGTSAPAPTPTPSTPTLPNSGTDWPTYASAGLGILVILSSILIAL